MFPCKDYTRTSWILKKIILRTIRNYVNIENTKHLTCFLCEHCCVRKRSSWNGCCPNVRTNALHLTWHILKLGMSGYIWKIHEDERAPLDFFALKSTEVLPWHLCSNPGMTIPILGSAVQLEYQATRGEKC